MVYNNNNTKNLVSKLWCKGCWNSFKNVGKKHIMDEIWGKTSDFGQTKNWYLGNIFLGSLIIIIVREAQKHSIVQYKSGAKVKQEKAYALFKKKKMIYLGRHNVDNRLNFRVVKIFDK